MATEALLSAPTAITIDSDGNVFFIDSGTNTIKMIVASDNTIQTVAGGIKRDPIIALLKEGKYPNEPYPRYINTGYRFNNEVVYYDNINSRLQNDNGTGTDNTGNPLGFYISDKHKSYEFFYIDDLTRNRIDIDPSENAIVDEQLDSNSLVSLTNRLDDINTNEYLDLEYNNENDYKYTDIYTGLHSIINEVKYYLFIDASGNLLDSNGLLNTNTITPSRCFFITTTNNIDPTATTFDGMYIKKFSIGNGLSAVTNTFDVSNLNTNIYSLTDGATYNIMYSSIDPREINKLPNVPNYVYYLNLSAAPPAPSPAPQPSPSPAPQPSPSPQRSPSPSPQPAPQPSPQPAPQPSPQPAPQPSPPLIITSVTRESSSLGIKINWNCEGDCGTSSRSYSYKYSIDGGINWNFMLNNSIILTGTTLSYIVNDVGVNTTTDVTCNVKIRKNNLSDDSTIVTSNTMSITIPRITPQSQITSLVSSNIRDSSFDLIWNAPSNETGGTVINRYYLELNGVPSNLHLLDPSNISFIAATGTTPLKMKTTIAYVDNNYILRITCQTLYTVRMQVSTYEFDQDMSVISNSISVTTLDCPTITGFAELYKPTLVLAYIHISSSAFSPTTFINNSGFITSVAQSQVYNIITSTNSNVADYNPLLNPTVSSSSSAPVSLLSNVKIPLMATSTNAQITSSRIFGPPSLWNQIYFNNTRSLRPDGTPWPKINKYAILDNSDLDFAKPSFFDTINLTPGTVGQPTTLGTVTGRVLNNDGSVAYYYIGRIIDTTPLNTIINYIPNFLPSYINQTGAYVFPGTGSYWVNNTSNIVEVGIFNPYSLARRTPAPAPASSSGGSMVGGSIMKIYTDDFNNLMFHDVTTHTDYLLEPLLDKNGIQKKNEIDSLLWYSTVDTTIVGAINLYDVETARPSLTDRLPHFTNEIPQNNINNFNNMIKIIKEFYNKNPKISCISDATSRIIIRINELIYSKMPSLSDIINSDSTTETNESTPETDESTPETDKTDKSTTETDEVPIITIGSTIKDNNTNKYTVPISWTPLNTISTISIIFTKDMLPVLPIPQSLIKPINMGIITPENPGTKTFVNMAPGTYTVTITTLSDSGEINFATNTFTLN